MTVLVTGGAGFIGSHLTRALLARGERVVCLDNFDPFYDPGRKRANVAAFLRDPRYTLIEGDIRSPATVQEVFARHRPARVAHLAAMAGIPPSVRDPMLYEQVNIGGTVQVLQAAREFGTRTFLLASSSSVYGATQRVPFREDDPADRPLAPYAAAKRAAELMAYSFSYLHGLRVIVTRFFNAYGPAIRPDLAVYRFTRAVHRGEPLTLYGDGSIQRDYTYVEDTVGGVVAGLDWEGDYEIVNLGNSYPVSIRDLIRAIEQVVGRPAIIDSRPALAADAPVTYADLGKARRLLGYAPATPLADGLARVYDWYRREEEAGRA
jgi:UDP-glucuronate 4-epimerase